MNKYLNPASLLLIIIGGINWLLVGVFEFNLVNYTFGNLPMVEKSVYGLVGISALYNISLFRQICSESCNKD
mgnify:CR=1 FL=1